MSARLAQMDSGFAGLTSRQARRKLSRGLGCSSAARPDRTSVAVLISAYTDERAQARAISSCRESCRCAFAWLTFA